MQQGGEGHNQQGPGARPHNAVIAAHGQADGQAHQDNVLTAVVPRLRLLPEVLLHHQEHRHHRQSHQHQPLKHPVAQVHGDPGPEGRACQRSGCGPQGGAQLDLPAAEVFHRRDGRAGAVYHLVGSGGQMDGQSGHQVGGQGDESAAPGHAVHKAPQKDEGADEQAELQ